MECNPCSYSVAYSPSLQPVPNTFSVLRVWGKGKSCQNCVWDALILIIAGGFLLQTGQFVILLKDARPSLKELLHGNMLFENQKHALSSGSRTYSPGPPKKTFFYNSFPIFLSRTLLACVCLKIMSSNWIRLPAFLGRIQRSNCNTRQLELDSSSTEGLFSASLRLLAHIFSRHRQQRKWHVAPRCKTLD